MKIINSILLISTVVFFAACNSESTEETTKTEEPVKTEEPAKPKSQLEKDIETIDAHLSENGIKAQQTASGLRYVITQEGSGEQANAGQNVNVHYLGKLLDGTEFDQSYKRGQPLPFTLGQGMVIQGWDEGIGLLNPGAKATLYIPSPLAYGPRDLGIIPANSILIFDVELVSVEMPSPSGVSKSK